MMQNPQLRRDDRMPSGPNQKIGEKTWARMSAQSLRILKPQWPIEQIADVVGLETDELLRWFAKP